MLLSRKAMDVEKEIIQLKNFAQRTEEERLHFEKKSREAENLTARLSELIIDLSSGLILNAMTNILRFSVEESQKRASEAERLKNDLMDARVAEKEAKENLLSFLSLSTSAAHTPVSMSTLRLVSPERYLSASSQSLTDSNHMFEDNEANTYEFAENNDINDISLEIEKERTEYLAKSKQVQCQLKDLRNEIEMLKISENEFDRINAEQTRQGENKYSTLKKALKQKLFFL